VRIAGVNDPKGVAGAGHRYHVVKGPQPPQLAGRNPGHGHLQQALVETLLLVDHALRLELFDPHLHQVVGGDAVLFEDHGGVHQLLPFDAVLGGAWRALPVGVGLVVFVALQFLEIAIGLLDALRRPPLHCRSHCRPHPRGGDTAANLVPQGHHRLPSWVLEHDERGSR